MAIMLLAFLLAESVTKSISIAALAYYPAISDLISFSTFDAFRSITTSAFVVSLTFANNLLLMIQFDRFCDQIKYQFDSAKEGWFRAGISIVKQYATIASVPTGCFAIIMLALFYSEQVIRSS